MERRDSRQQWELTGGRRPPLSSDLDRVLPQGRSRQSTVRLTETIRRTVHGASAPAIHLGLHELTM